MSAVGKRCFSVDDVTKALKLFGYKGFFELQSEDTMLKLYIVDEPEADIIKTADENGFFLTAVRREFNSNYVDAFIYLRKK